MIELQGLIIAIYAALSLILPLPIKWYKRLFLLIIPFICGLKFYIYKQVGGIMSPQLPPYLVLILEALYGSLMLCVFFCLIKDVLSFIYFILKKLRVISFKVNRLKINATIALCAFGFGFYGTISQIFVPEVKAHEVAIKNLGTNFEGFKIVQLTDLHVGPILKGDFIEDVVAKVNELDPDLVLITGDFVDGRVSALKTEFQALTKIKAPFGILAVTGNHEYYSGASAWIEALKDYGVRFLQNEHTLLKKGTDSLIVAGVNDRRSGDSNLVKAFLNAKENTPRILMAHEPWDGTKQLLANFILSGHTHGGTMIFLQPLITSYNNGFVSGMYQINDETSLYVSNGTGIWSGFSCRFLVPAEISLFTLTQGK